jgi:hypothetical protein
MQDLDRRSFLRAGLAVAGTGVLSACGLIGGPDLVGPDSPQVQAADERRRRTGRTRALTYAAIAAPIDRGS